MDDWSRLDEAIALARASGEKVLVERAIPGRKVDFFLPTTTAGHIQPVVNEVNIMPGFTAMSQYPRIWRAGGIQYPKLLDVLIETALEQRRAPKLAVARETVR